MAQATDSPKTDEVGWLFVQQYYTMMNKTPGKLHLFYKKESSFVHGTEGETVKLSQGQQEIHDKISDLGLKDCKVLVSNVDSQASIEGGILIQVLGEISNDGQESRKFAQTFGLAPQETGYYVYNDIFRFLKEDVDSESGDDQHYEPVLQGSSVPSLPNELSASETATLFSLDAPQSQGTPAPAQPASAVPETHFNGVTSEAVAEIEKAAAAEPVQEIESLAQEVIPSPVQTPVVNGNNEAKSTEQTSAAVEAIAAEPAADVKPETSKPSAPMSWAARAAQNAASKAPSTSSPKVVTPKPTLAKPVSAVEPERKPQSSGGGGGGAAVADVTRSAFLKNISAKMTDEAIRAALKKFGDFKNVEINRSRSCGFVDYLEPASCAAAIQSNRVSINGETLFVEERRRDVNGKIGPKEKKFETRGGEASRGGRGGTARGGGKTGRGAAQVSK